jgi:elongation factor Ts
MAISLEDIKKLRELSGAGMADCKKALEASNGDIEGAIDNLRALGQKISGKRADREAKEGVCIALTSHNRNNGIAMRLCCETDFVSKNEGFIALAQSIAEAALKSGAENVEALMGVELEAGITVAQKLQDQIAALAEKIEVSDYGIIKTAAGEGQVIPYIHMGNRAAVIVALNLEGPEYVEPGKDVAMQVAAMKPVAVNKDLVDAELIARELEVYKEQTRSEGKPEDMVEKIAAGRLNKFFKESTLLSQDFVKDGSKTVGDHLKSIHKDLLVTHFVHVANG